MDNKENNMTINIVIFVIIAVAVSLYLFKGGNTVDKTRTIMIYMSGSDLESKAGAATSDINAIIPNEVDLNSLNVLLYTGGSKTWHNDFVNNNENAIYELTVEGFKKKKSYSQLNMSVSETLENFLMKMLSMN